MAASDSLSEDSSILYELRVHLEWIQDSDGSGPKPFLSHSNSGIWSKAGVRSLFSPWKLLKKPTTIPEEVTYLVQSQFPWQLAVSSDGKVAAILQETVLEVRTSRDEYSSILGKTSIQNDPHPQWRRLAWSPDNSVLAVASSSGVVSLYDLLACSIATIPAIDENPDDDIRAVAALIFLQPKLKNTKWSSELLIVDYQGNLRSYFISAFDGCQENMKYSFVHRYPQGIASVVYHPSHHVLITSGPYSPSVSSNGLTVWRILNDHPYLRIALDTPRYTKSSSFFRFLPVLSTTKKPSVILKMKISPNGQLLACVHSCGSVSLWHLPGLRLYNHWSLAEQPNHHVCNPQSLESIKSEQFFYPVDVDWWSDHVLIIARRSGAVSVCSVTTLKNLLGESPEFLSGLPQISSIRGGRPAFLVLECEVTSSIRNRLRSEESDQESEEDTETSMLQANIQAALYSFTDIERFQPKRKTPRLIQRTYRMIGLKSTTPEELYSRKIENQEYEDALSLAKTYNLDCDLVYQRQWRISNVSVDTIQSYLGKVKKILWVANECVERVPDSSEAARALLQFGLKITQLEADEREMVNTSSEKRQLAEYRKKLFVYLDNLTIYEKVIGLHSNYNHVDYDEFRKQTPIKSTTKFARQENWQAVSIMFTFRGEDVLPHWLPILSNFPETLLPFQYRSLLPEIIGSEVVPWETKILRFPDWCEREPYRSYLNVPQEDSGSDFLYKDENTLKQFQRSPLSVEQVTDWYRWRTYQIEEKTCLVDHALNLVKLARERSIKGLDRLYGDLLTLDTLVYMVGEDGISLAKLQMLSPLDQSKLLLSKTREDTFVEDVKNFFLPFALRCEKQYNVPKMSLMRGLLVHMSENDLSLPLKLFEHLRDDENSPLAITVSERMSLALDCLYSCTRDDQLENAFSVLECLPDRGGSVLNSEEEKLHDLVDELEKHLSGCEILERNDHPKSLMFIKENQNNEPVAKSLIEDVAENTKLKSMDFTELLNDLLELQSKVFTCVPIQFCYETFAYTQLSCECEEIIISAEEVLECRRGETGKMIPFYRSVDLVLQSARAHFDRSASAEDPSIKLAHVCLTLISEPHTEVHEELDLIESLQLLADFGVNVLPIQVRICPNRIKLIETCLDAKSKAYKYCERLLQLSHVLRVAGDDRLSREGQVLSLIAKQALKMNDYQFCSEICSRLINRNYRQAWTIARSLGECKQFYDVKQRLVLLAFALLHCPVETVEDLVESRLALKKSKFSTDDISLLQTAKLSVHVETKRTNDL